MSLIDFTVFLPPKALEGDVVCVRVASYTHDQGLEIKTCPNGLPGIVFQLGEKGSAIESIAIQSAHITDLPTLFLHGQGSEPSIMKFKKGAFTTIQTVLKPYALYTLFGLDASAMTRGFLQPDEFGAGHLQTQLVTTSDNAARVTLLQEFLIGKLQQANPRDILIEECVDFIHKNVRTVTVKSLLEECKIPERQLQKRFARVVGCSPGQYIRVKRVNEALRLISFGHYKKLSDVAYELNYYDQSHFIRDIKALSWITPKSITQDVTDFRQDQTGASYL